MAKALHKIEPNPQPAEPTKAPLEALVERVIEDATRRASSYREDTLVPGGGE